MIETVLGKIDFAEFGTFSDRPFLMGLELGFSFNGSGVFSGGKYTVNISDECKWSEAERQAAITKQAVFLRDLLKAAKCNYVSELIGKPVEVTIKNGWFEDFRILTEVL